MAGIRALLLLLLIVGIMEGVSAGKRKKPCKYNKKKYPAGEVIESAEENCMELRCSKKGKKVELVVIEGCTCCKGTEPSTEPPIGPTNGPTDGPSTCSNCDYSQFGSTHTMLLPINDGCGPFDLRGVTATDIATILETHNTLRAKVANGAETQGCSDGPDVQPGASNMLEMHWNCQLAEVAQAWAEQCVSGHDSYGDRKICASDYSVGQNVYSAWNSDPESEWGNAIQAWYSEVKDMPASLVDSFGSNTCSTQGVIGHYTQVVWAETYEVGCGVIHYPDTLQGFALTAKVYVCNYGKAGNWLSSPVYLTGSAASDCEYGSSTLYPELCNAYPQR